MIRCTTSNGSRTTTLPELRSPEVHRRAADWLWIVACWGTAVLCVGSVIVAALEAARRERPILAISLIGVAVAVICRMLVSQDPCLLRALGLSSPPADEIEEEATVEISGIRQCFEIAPGDLDDWGNSYVLVTRDEEYLLVWGVGVSNTDAEFVPAESVTLRVQGSRRSVIRWSVSGASIEPSGLVELRDPSLMAEYNVALLDGADSFFAD